MNWTKKTEVRFWICPSPAIGNASASQQGEPEKSENKEFGRKMSKASADKS